MSTPDPSPSDDDTPPRAVLRANRPLRLLWSSRTISVFGDSLSLVTLLLHIAGGSGQAFAVAALLLVGDFAPALLGPFAGVVSDRFDLRRVMVSCELVQAAAVAVIAVTLPPLPLLLALVALRATAGRVFQPASLAAVPLLVEDRRLESANAALGFGANGTEAVGPLAAAALLPLLGVRGTLLVDVATFLVSALLLVFLPRLPAARVDGPRPTASADAAAGLRHLLTAPVVRAVSLGFVAVVAFTGVDDVALVFLSRDSLHGGGSAVALLYGAVGIGLVAGYALCARRTPRLPLVALVVAGFAISSAGNLLTGFAWAVAAAFAAQLLRGVGLSAMDVGVNTLVQREVPAPLRGRVFGSLYGAVGAAAATSYLLGALLLALTDPRTTFIVAGGGGMAAAVATAVAVSRTRKPPIPR